MKFVRISIAILILGMGVIHIVATPALKWATPRAGMDFAGTGMATVLLGLVNLEVALCRDQGRRPGLLVQTVNMVMMIFLGVFMIVAFEPPVGVASALTFATWLINLRLELEASGSAGEQRSLSDKDRLGRL